MRHQLGNTLLYVLDVLFPHESTKTKSLQCYFDVHFACINHILFKNYLIHFVVRKLFTNIVEEELSGHSIEFRNKK